MFITPHRVDTSMSHKYHHVTTAEEIRKVATTLGLECEVVESLNHAHFEVTVTEGKKSAQQQLAEYIKNVKPNGSTFNVIDDTPEQRYWDKIGGLSESDKTMREIQYKGHTITITKGFDLYVDGIDITNQYSGEPVTEGTICEIKHRIAAGELPQKENGIKIENISELFRNSDGCEKNTVESVKQKYVEGEIGILELEEQLEDVVELDYDPVAHPS